MVFYRKYRPQKISELDSEAVRNSLYAIFSKFSAKDASVAHAFLFSGPKGLGKTSTARIVAKVINCEKHQGNFKPKDEKNIEPCNKCLQCVSITNGNNFDVLEIDGASNRGIEEIRDLKEKINLLPSKASKKVYIIDEVHMLTTEAFNALLKTLEEPPQHAVFVLCTTEFGKLPQTIVSRCFRVDFKKATAQELARSLKRIVKSEDIKIDDDALSSIAAVSDESFREAVKILEELSLFAGRKKISKDFFEEKYNTLGIEKSLEEIIETFKSREAKKAFDVIAKLSISGTDFKYFIEKLLGEFHKLLIESLSMEGEFETGEIKQIIELLAKAHMETKYSVLPSLPLELAVVEWASEEATNTHQDLSSPVKQANSSVRSHAKLGARSFSETLVKTSGQNASRADNFFENFISEVKFQNNLLAGVLRSCFAEQILDGKLEIVARSKFHKEKLEEQKSMKVLENAANTLSGKNVKVHITLRG